MNVADCRPERPYREIEPGASKGTINVAPPERPYPRGSTRSPSKSSTESKHSDKPSQLAPLRRDLLFTPYFQNIPDLVRSFLLKVDTNGFFFCFFLSPTTH